MHDEGIIAAARMIYEAKKIVVFTGAGISTESGVPRGISLLAMTGIFTFPA
jgi:NAD-dependent SIR2 family protein deacetylase